MDLPVTDVLLELRQRRRRVSPVEAADRHHRVAGRELITRRTVGPGRRCDPCVATRVRLEQANEVRRWPAAVEEPGAPTRIAAGIATKGGIRASVGEATAEASTECAPRSAESPTAAAAGDSAARSAAARNRRSR